MLTPFVSVSCTRLNKRLRDDISCSFLFDRFMVLFAIAETRSCFKFTTLINSRILFSILFIFSRNFSCFDNIGAGNGFESASSLFSFKYKRVVSILPALQRIFCNSVCNFRIFDFMSSVLCSNIGILSSSY